jgi:hypothetical protein
MTGWRLGYVCAPELILKQMLKIHQFAIMCAPTTSQYAAVEAIKNGDEDVKLMRSAYDQRRRFLLDAFKNMGLECFEPFGAFYVFPSVKQFGLTSEEFAGKFLEAEKVAVVPGTAFGECGEGYVRISYAYSIENMQCYAQSLHEVCVSVTLNDHRIFDFVNYMTQYSEAIFPLFVWSVWAYRTGNYNRFSMTDFARVIDPGKFNVLDPLPSLVHLRSKVGRKVKQLQSEFPSAKTEYLDTKASVKALGVTPQTTYLYIQGHHLFDNVVVPILNKVCNRLRLERQEEIYHTAVHHEQRRNEMSCYEHSLQDIRQMLKKNTGYKQSAQFERIQQDVELYLESEQTTTDS